MDEAWYLQNVDTYVLKYSKPLVIQYPSSHQHFQTQFACLSTYQKQSCVAHVFTYRVIVLPVATSSTACHPALYRYHYSRSDPRLWCSLVELVVALQFI
jgi:hypothetical protein